MFFYNIHPATSGELDITIILISTLKHLLSNIKHLLSNIKHQTSNIKHTYSYLPVHLELNEAVGGCFRCTGFTNFMELVPFLPDAAPGSVAIDVRREWLLPVLHSNLRLHPCSLCDFAVVILSMVDECKSVLTNNGMGMGMGIGIGGSILTQTQTVQLARTRVLQLWSLFPDFCFAGPTDIPNFFPRIVGNLEMVLKESRDADGGGHSHNNEAVIHVLTGLTHIANAALDRSSIIGGVGGPGIWDPSTHNSNSTSTSTNNNDNGKLTIYNRDAVVNTPSSIALAEQANVVLPAVLMYLEGARVGDNTFAMGVRTIYFSSISMSMSMSMSLLYR